MARPSWLSRESHHGSSKAALATCALAAAAVAGCTAASPPGAGLLASDNPAGQLATMRLVDQQSGWRYDALGRPIEGASKRLRPLPGYNQFWFAWSVFNHDSAIFGTERRVETAPLAPGDGCAVPCDELRLGCSGTDCIPALDGPSSVPAASGGAAYLPDNAFVVGVIAGAQARAYPHNILWWHEIVNDTVGGTAVSITHCPLTFSSLGHDPTAFGDGATHLLGVSGRLYNSNLVFYDRSDGTWYSQLLGVGTKGKLLGRSAPRTAVWEMSWLAWRTLVPDTEVLSNDTGFARDYQRYPYGDYFTDDGDTFGPTAPAPDPTFPAKAPTYGLRLGGEAKAYPHASLAAWAREQYGATAPPAGVVNDSLGGEPIAVVFDIDAGYVQAFARDGGELGLER